jgi:hypothetical protein
MISVQASTEDYLSFHFVIKSRYSQKYELIIISIQAFCVKYFHKVRPQLHAKQACYAAETTETAFSRPLPGWNLTKLRLAVSDLE